MLSKNETMDALAKAKMFATLDEAGRAALAGEMREATYEAGQIIFSRGDEGGELHLVVRGRVRLSVLTNDGRELSFAHCEPPSIFGELAVFDGRPRSADATAVSKVVTLTLSKASFSRLLSKHPQIGEAAIRFLSARLRDADEQLEAIALLPIEARLARFFLAAARAKDADAKAAKVNISLPISQSELALLVGASRPKVNAALALLEGEGAIERRGAIVVCDIGALTALSGVS